MSSPSCPSASRRGFAGRGTGAVGSASCEAGNAAVHDPDPPGLIGIEEPENFLHPRLLPELGEECRAASARTQLLITTHSPFFLDALRPQEARVLWRDEDGYMRAESLSKIKGMREFVKEGATLGDLWMEGHFRVGDPLVNEGAGADRSGNGRRSA